ncbi:MAG: hypothetical protein NWE89_06365 [Candidatus Bathyarchaeota archaeon]|nr:hypothetical protein [Candidatus Bathyarchaeota archaeon]
MSCKGEMLRHFLASIAYHATKAIKDAPSDYPDLDAGFEVRTPRQILHHITGVLSYAHSFYEHYETTYFDHKPWKDEVGHFYSTLHKLDESIRQKQPQGVTEEQILQGPFSDAMAHIGQLLTLRRIAGAPVHAENFVYADIKKGVLGPDQPDPVAPDS